LAHEQGSVSVQWTVSCSASRKAMLVVKIGMQFFNAFTASEALVLQP